MEKLRWTIRRWIEVHKGNEGIKIAATNASYDARHDLTIVEAQCERLSYETPCVTYTPSQLNRFNCMWKQYHDDLQYYYYYLGRWITLMDAQKNK